MRDVAPHRVPIGVHEENVRHILERVEAFEKGAQAFAKKIVANFKDFEFYTGENMNPDGMVALLNYREDGITRECPPRTSHCIPNQSHVSAYFTFWKDGLKEIKL